MTNPNGHEVARLLDLANDLSSKSQFQAAANCYLKILKLSKPTAPLMFNLGNAQKQSGNLRAAMQSYAKAIKLDPALSVARLSLGITLELANQMDEAANAYESVLSDTKIAVEGYVRLATLMMKRRRYEEGLDYALQGLKLDQHNLDLTLVLLACASALKRHELVIQYAESYLRDDKDNILAKKYLAEALCRVGESEKGISILKGISTEGINGLISAFPSLVFHLSGEGLKAIEAQASQVEEFLTKNSNVQSGLFVELAFPLSSFLHSQKKYQKAYDFLQKANAAKRQTFRYETSKMEDYFSRSVNYGGCLQSLADPNRFPEEPRIIFVLGLPRSGTTLVEQILDSHSQVAGCGELEAANRGRAALEKELQSCGGDEGVTLGHLEKFRQNYLRHLQSFGDAKFYVDKMPDNLHHLALLLAVFPSAKVILCQRSEIENAFSIFRQSFQGMHPYAYDIEELKHYIGCCSQLSIIWQQRYEKQILKLDYEKVVNDLEGQTMRLLDHCGLAFEPECLAFHKNKRVVNTASSAQVRRGIYKNSLVVAENYPDFVGKWNESSYGKFCPQQTNLPRVKVDSGSE